MTTNKVIKLSSSYQYPYMAAQYVNAYNSVTHLVVMLRLLNVDRRPSWDRAEYRAMTYRLIATES